MDKGAARSKRRAQLLEKAVQQKTLLAQKPSGKKSASSRPSSSSEAGPSKPRPKPLREPKKRPVPEEQSRDPELYKPKAIRSAHALVWPCEVPPASLEGITRVDLTNSGVKDVSWLRDSGVRWLSVSGCLIDDWSAVGSLSELTVLNMNECGLTSLPKELRGLKNLKALVAMNNPWKSIEDDTIDSWPELNSLSGFNQIHWQLTIVISHSPNLVSLPSLRTAIHLTKLTFSHCPRLTPASIPDLSTLPLVHDIKMNNLPLLTSLPPHLLAWGTGPMSSLDSSDTRKGLGLETLDIGSSSLEAKVLDSFKSARMGNLRSLTLHHNPLAAERPDYADELLQSGTIPKLQIVDNKRVVEKKKHEPVKKKKSGKEKKGKPTGSNDSGNVKMRSWGGKGADAAEGASEDNNEAEKAVEAREGKVQGSSKEKKRKRSGEDEQVPSEKREKRVKGDPTHKLEKGDRKVDRSNHKSTDRQAEDRPAKADSSNAARSVRPAAVAATAAQTSKVADPSALTTDKAHRHSKNETGVYGVVEVAGAPGQSVKSDKKGKKEKRKPQADPVAEPVPSAKTGGIDLKAMLNKSDDNGLGVGGW